MPFDIKNHSNIKRYKIIFVPLRIFSAVLILFFFYIMYIYIGLFILHICTTLRICTLVVVNIIYTKEKYIYKRKKYIYVKEKI